MINNPIIYKFFKDFTNHFLTVDISPTFLDTGATNDMENKTPSDTY